MADLSPLVEVYTLFQTGQSGTNVRRFRYPAGGTTVGVDGLLERGVPTQTAVPVFRVPQSGRGQSRGATRNLDDYGASSTRREVVYSTADWLTTDANIDQPADILVDGENRVWTVVGVNDWQRLPGNPPGQQYEITIEWSGVRLGEAPFDA